MSDLKTNPSDNQHKNDEIDLIQLFSSIGDWFKNLFVGIFGAIGKILITILYFSLRNYITLFIIFVISISFYFAKFHTTKYESNMKVKANAISNQEAINYINRLSNLTKGEDKSELQKQLNIDSITTSKITDIDASWFIDSDGDGVDDYIDLGNEYFKAADDSISRRITAYFNIRIGYIENIDVSLISERLIDYFNKNPYFVKANEIRKTQQLQTFNITKIEQKKLDTIRINYNKAIFESIDLPETRNGQLIFLNGDQTDFQKIKLFHPELFSLEEKAQKLTRSLELNPDIISILENFTLSNKPLISLFDYSKYSIFFFIFGVICVIIFENRKKIIELKKKSEIK